MHVVAQNPSYRFVCTDVSSCLKKCYFIHQITVSTDLENSNITSFAHILYAVDRSADFDVDVSIENTGQIFFMRHLPAVVNSYILSVALHRCCLSTL